MLVALCVISFTLTVTLRNCYFPCSVDGAPQLAQLVKKLPVSTGDTRDTRGTGSTPGLGRSPGVGKGNPLWYSCRNGCRESDMTEHVLAGWLAGCFMDEEIETHVKNLSRTTQLLSD